MNSKCIPLILQVIVHAGPRLAKALPFGPVPAKSLKVEYSSLECAMEIVDDVEDAIRHINDHGSAHTDAIVTECGQYHYVTLWLSCVTYRDVKCI